MITDSSWVLLRCQFLSELQKLRVVGLGGKSVTYDLWHCNFSELVCPPDFHSAQVIASQQRKLDIKIERALGIHVIIIYKQIQDPRSSHLDKSSLLVQD